MILRPFTALRLSAKLEELSFSPTDPYEQLIMRAVVTVVSRRGKVSYREKSFLVHVLLFLLFTIPEQFYITISYLEKV